MTKQAKHVIVGTKGVETFVTKTFSPITIKNMTLKNRIVMSPMCMYSCDQEDGKLTDWHFTHYISRAVGGVGLVMLEASAVTPQGRISPHDLGIWDDEHIDGMQKLAKQVHANGAKIGVQIAHAGRKANLKEEIIAPSALRFNEKLQIPKEMTKTDIDMTMKAFQDAAQRAKQASFDVIELHAAHGYLINEFLSPLTNKRTDEYGGSKENRYRFLQETLGAIKQVWDGPLFVRISASDYDQGGLTITDYEAYASWLKADGVDLIDCSSGGVLPAAVHAYPGYQVQFAEKVRHSAGMATAAVGLITSGLQAEEILQNERADLIFVARALLRNPYWAVSAAKELGETSIQVPVQYERGWL